ncbi:flagellar protein FlaG [Betaproteobacteria bacterium]|nr:flagellar protein FlaG [Betaproteobacteria bacterium]
MEKLDNIRSAVVSTTKSNAKPNPAGAVIDSSQAKSTQLSIIKSTVKPPEVTSSATAKNSKMLAETIKNKEEKVREAVKEINNELAKQQSELGFSVDKVAKDVVVTVKRKETGEVVRQIPSETILKLAHNFEKLKGILLDEKF